MRSFQNYISFKYILIKFVVLTEIDDNLWALIKMSK